MEGDLMYTSTTPVLVYHVWKHTWNESTATRPERNNQTLIAIFNEKELASRKAAYMQASLTNFDREYNHTEFKIFEYPLNQDIDWSCQDLYRILY